MTTSAVSSVAASPDRSIESTATELPEAAPSDETPPQRASNAEISATDAAVVFHSWSKQGGLKPLPLACGQGTTVWDHDGNRYLDFSGEHPKIIAGITEQARGTEGYSTVP